MLSYLKLLALAKQLLRLRMNKNFSWSYYAQPSTCLYGPHSSVGFWSDTSDLEHVLKLNGLPFNAYDQKAEHPSGQVLKLARKLAERHQFFVDHVNDWQEEERFHFADNSIEVIEVNRFGATRRRIIDGPHGDACY